ncbi:zinc metalloprotease HtpX [Kocuria palustris]|uniref:zinc metalloprotease HtpX n=1 Tax=Kocuria palustris TaxID=71999 RepID=UPI00119D1001|nr:zinc metalloprotease HtpX [Kocuria palustris]
MHRHFNGLKTAALLGGMWGLLILIGYGLAVSSGSSVFILLFALIGLGTTAYSYWNSDKLALRSMRAVEVSEQQAPWLHATVRELSDRAQQPMPRLYVSPTSSPNAFATGRNPQNSAVCVTEGILQLLSQRELRGVLGHELQHVYNRDILTSSVAAAISGIITSIAQFLQFAAVFGRGGDERGNPLAALAVAFLAPVGASVIQMAISRTREFDADEAGARLTGDPLALASALNKIEHGVNARPLSTGDQSVVNTSSMMIANPFRGGGLSRMFSTHPPTAERIQRLQGMVENG